MSLNPQSFNDECTDKDTKVDNDFHQTHSIFHLFEGLDVKDMGKTPTIPSHLPNGNHSTEAVNGNSGNVNGVNSPLRN